MTTPRWVVLPAALGMLLVALPLAGLLSKVPWPGLWELLTSQSSLAALQLSILTASVSTVFCIVLGVPMALVLALSSPFSGRMVGRRGTRPSLVIGGAGVSLAGLMLALLPADARMWYLLVAFMVLGVGLGFVNPPITTTAVAGLPLSQAGAASGMASASRQVGVALGVAVAGSVAGADDARLVAASRPVFWLAVALGLVVVVLGVISTTEWARGTRRRLNARCSAGGGAAGRDGERGADPRGPSFPYHRADFHPWAAGSSEKVPFKTTLRISFNLP